MGDIMKKKFILLVICFITFISGVCSVRAKTYDYSKSCNSKTAQQLAKVIYKEAGFADITIPSEDQFFNEITTANVVINNASTKKGKDWYTKLLNLNSENYAYANYGSYKDKSFDSVVAKDRQGRMLYIAELVLTGKYGLPKNMVGQASCACLLGKNACAGIDIGLASADCTDSVGWGKEWTHLKTVAGLFDSYFGYRKNESLAKEDVFGNKITDTSVAHYKQLANSLKLSDYSKYTVNTVCTGLSGNSGSSGNSGNSGNSSSGDGTTTPNIPEEVVIDVPACENPEVLRVIYFITLLIDIVKLVVPIGLVIVGMIDFSKGVVATDEGAQKKVIKIFVKRVIYAILIFAVPWIVKTVMVNLGNLTEGVNFTDCLENANKDSIAKYDAKLKELEDAAKSNTSSD